VDDSAAVRGAIRQFVEDTTRFRVCDEASDGLAAIQKAKDFCCELVLLHIGMPQKSGVEIASELRLALPDIKIVGFSTLAKELGEELVASKAFDAVLSKSDGLTKLVETLKSLMPVPPMELLQLSTVRILVVDDFALFRQFVVGLLGKRPELQVVGEASDGLEALQRAVELRPDLILLDIGLPSLNGIEVARQTRSLVPESKIIFLTQESSADVVQEALSLGAWGYVTKTKAQADLFAAVDAVLAGMTFVSTL
jgi:DNA-binding NarL/FixJ family response regulator